MSWPKMSQVIMGNFLLTLFFFGGWQVGQVPKKVYGQSMRHKCSKSLSTFGVEAYDCAWLFQMGCIKIFFFWVLFIVKLGETVRADHPHCFGHRAKKCRWNVATSISLMQQYKQKCNGLLIYFLPNDLLYPKALTSLTQKIQLHLHLSTLLPVGMFNVSLSHEVNLHKHVVWRGSWKFWRLCMDVAIYVDIHIDICINIYIYQAPQHLFLTPSDDRSHPFAVRIFGG